MAYFSLLVFVGVMIGDLLWIKLLFGFCSILHVWLTVGLIRQTISHRRGERNNRAKLVLSEGSLERFDQTGILSDTLRMDDIFLLALYHGNDETGQNYEDCVIHRRDGTEFLLNGIVVRKRALMSELERRAGSKFQYRKNSSRANPN